VSESSGGVPASESMGQRVEAWGHPTGHVSTTRAMEHTRVNESSPRFVSSPILVSGPALHSSKAAAGQAAGMRGPGRTRWAGYGRVMLGQVRPGATYRLFRPSRAMMSESLCVRVCVCVSVRVSERCLVGGVCARGGPARRTGLDWCQWRGVCWTGASGGLARRGVCQRWTGTARGHVL
jgi:hypothetical protein